MKRRTGYRLSAKVRDEIQSVLRREIAAQIGISTPCLHRWLYDASPGPKDPRVRAIGRILDVPPDQLVEDVPGFRAAL